MAGPRTTGMKKQKERQRAEKRAIKEEKKARRKTERIERVAGGEDPDLAGIVLGPQAPLE